MFEILEKIILAGVGIANLTREKAETIIETLIEKGEIKAKDKKAVLSRLLNQTKKLDAELEEKIKDISLEVVKGSQKQIGILSKKIAELAKQMEAEKSSKVKAAGSGKGKKKHKKA